MTLKKCTVTQLDDTFWRVDFEERIRVGLFQLASPQVVKRFGERWFVQGYPEEDASSLALLLHRLGLTAEQPQEETAEERVRAFLAMHNEDTTIMDIGPNARSSLEAADLRAILAELDMVRDELTRRECWKAEYVVLSEKYGKLFMEHDFSKQELDRLRARRPVDVESVLAPFRELVARGERYMREADGLGRHNAEGGSYRFAAEDFHKASEWFCVVDAVKGALAEAKKIARGE